MDDFQEAVQERREALLERWLRMVPWACGGGLQGTAESARATLLATTDQFLHLAPPECRVDKLKAFRETLIEIRKLEAWVDGPPWKSRGICTSCGTLYREEFGPCRDGPSACSGEIEQAGEDGYVIEARSAQKRLSLRLSELIKPAEAELRSIVEPHSGERTAAEQRPGSALPSSSAPCVEELRKPSSRQTDGIVPALKVGQMPARILVTLLENGGEMVKQDVHRKHRGQESKDDPRLANLLTPRSELSRRGFIESKDAIVTLTEGGRREAELQKSRGTRPVGLPDSQSTHD